MFGIFKKKSEKEKLQIKYQQLKEKAFNMSKINRKESDKLEVEAQKILDILEKTNN
tara:strand:+ start:209 stop:376 length:168 start_codon:yes stop_codon:yes gene_type:complete